MDNTESKVNLSLPPACHKLPAVCKNPISAQQTPQPKVNGAKVQLVTSKPEAGDICIIKDTGWSMKSGHSKRNTPPKCCTKENENQWKKMQTVQSSQNSTAERHTSVDPAFYFSPRLVSQIGDPSNANNNLESSNSPRAFSKMPGDCHVSYKLPPCDCPMSSNANPSISGCFVPSEHQNLSFSRDMYRHSFSPLHFYMPVNRLPSPLNIAESHHRFTMPRFTYSPRTISQNPVVSNFSAPISMRRTPEPVVIQPCNSPVPEFFIPTRPLQVPVRYANKGSPSLRLPMFNTSPFRPISPVGIARTEVSVVKDYSTSPFLIRPKQWNGSHTKPLDSVHFAPITNIITDVMNTKPNIANSPNKPLPNQTIPNVVNANNVVNSATRSSTTVCNKTPNFKANTSTSSPLVVSTTNTRLVAVPPISSSLTKPTSHRGLHSKILPSNTVATNVQASIFQNSKKTQLYRVQNPKHEQEQETIISLTKNDTIPIDVTKNEDTTNNDKVPRDSPKHEVQNATCQDFARNYPDNAMGEVSNNADISKAKTRNNLPSQKKESLVKLIKKHKKRRRSSNETCLSTKKKQKTKSPTNKNVPKQDKSKRSTYNVEVNRESPLQLVVHKGKPTVDQEGSDSKANIACIEPTDENCINKSNVSLALSEGTTMSSSNVKTEFSFSRDIVTSVKEEQETTAQPEKNSFGDKNNCSNDILSHFCEKKDTGQSDSEGSNLVYRHKLFDKLRSRGKQLVKTEPVSYASVDIKDSTLLKTEMKGKIHDENANSRDVNETMNDALAIKRETCIERPNLLPPKTSLVNASTSALSSNKAATIRNQVTKEKHKSESLSVLNETHPVANSKLSNATKKTGDLNSAPKSKERTNMHNSASPLKVKHTTTNPSKVNPDNKISKSLMTPKQTQAKPPNVNPDRKVSKSLMTPKQTQVKLLNVNPECTSSKSLMTPKQTQVKLLNVNPECTSSKSLMTPKQTQVKLLNVNPECTSSKSLMTPKQTQAKPLNVNPECTSSKSLMTSKQTQVKLLNVNPECTSSKSLMTPKQTQAKPLNVNPECTSSKSLMTSKQTQVKLLNVNPECTSSKSLMTPKQTQAKPLNVNPERKITKSPVESVSGVNQFPVLQSCKNLTKPRKKKNKCVTAKLEEQFTEQSLWLIGPCTRAIKQRLTDILWDDKNISTKNPPSYDNDKAENTELSPQNPKGIPKDTIGGALIGAAIPPKVVTDKDDKRITTHSCKLQSEPHKIHNKITQSNDEQVTNIKDASLFKTNKEKTRTENPEAVKECVVRPPGISRKHLQKERKQVDREKPKDSQAKVTTAYESHEKSTKLNNCADGFEETRRVNEMRHLTPTHWQKEIYGGLLGKCLHSSLRRPSLLNSSHKTNGKPHVSFADDVSVYKFDDASPASEKVEGNIAQCVDKIAGSNISRKDAYLYELKNTKWVDNSYCLDLNSEKNMSCSDEQGKIYKEFEVDDLLERGYMKAQQYKPGSSTIDISPRILSSSTPIKKDTVAHHMCNTSNFFSRQTSTVKLSHVSNMPEEKKADIIARWNLKGKSVNRDSIRHDQKDSVRNKSCKVQTVDDQRIKEKLNSGAGVKYSHPEVSQGSSNPKYPLSKDVKGKHLAGSINSLISTAKTSTSNSQRQQRIPYIETKKDDSRDKDKRRHEHKSTCEPNRMGGYQLTNSNRRFSLDSRHKNKFEKSLPHVIVYEGRSNVSEKINNTNATEDIRRFSLPDINLCREEKSSGNSGINDTTESTTILNVQGNNEKLLNLQDLTGFLNSVLNKDSRNSNNVINDQCKLVKDMLQEIMKQKMRLDETEAFISKVKEDLSNQNSNATSRDRIHSEKLCAVKPIVRDDISGTKNCTSTSYNVGNDSSTVGLVQMPNTLRNECISVMRSCEQIATTSGNSYHSLTSHSNELEFRLEVERSSCDSRERGYVYFPSIQRKARYTAIDGVPYTRLSEALSLLSPACTRNGCIKPCSKARQVIVTSYSDLLRLQGGLQPFDLLRSKKTEKELDNLRVNLQMFCKKHEMIVTDIKRAHSKL